MTTNISYSSSDGYLGSSSTSYASAQSGVAIGVNTAATTVRVGQEKSGATYNIWEAFFQFPYTYDAQVIRVSGYFDFYVESALGTGAARDLGARAVTWGTLDTADWKTVGGITALTRVGLAGDVHTATAKHVYAATEDFNNMLESNGTVQVVLYDSRFTASAVPTTSEYIVISSIEGGAATDPSMVWTTVPMHSLVRVGSCQVQLSDGRHAYLDANGGGDVGLLVTLRLNNGSTTTDIATNVLVSSARLFGYSNQGMQSVALVRDGDDNLYVISHRASNGNALNVVAWEKIGVSTWAERAPLTADMPANAGVINNLAACWHNVGTEGTIMVVGSHEPTGAATSAQGQMFYALLNCANMLNGSGSLLRSAGDALPYLVSAGTNAGDHNAYLNEVGSCLDITALPGSNDRGVVVSQSRTAAIGDYAPVSVVRYQLNSVGTGLLDTDGGESNPISLWGTKDGGAKIRVLPVSTSTWVVVTIDRDVGWGPTIRVFQNFGTAATFTELGGALLGDEGLVTLPAPSAMDTSSAWDAVYQPDTNQVWFYYFDTADGRRLMRTAFDMNTFQAVANEIQVATAIGAVGSTNHAIRVQRGRLTESEVLVTIANKTSGNTQSTIYLVDRLNVAPAAPTLVDKLNYDATSSNLFEWIFNDPNVGDTQSAYEFQIDNADTAASVVNTGKITSTSPNRTVAASTLTNGVNYRWRVRTYDSSDLVGAWSNYDFFSTAAGGVTNITSPATDNVVGIVRDDVPITWSVSGTTQASYRVRVVRTSNEAQLSDTGYVSSSATSVTVAGLLSDVEYRVEVTVRNSGLVSTNTATRLITPNYNEPEVPIITVVADNDRGNVTVSIQNPTPQGDKPEVSVNQVQRRSAGIAEWTTIAKVGRNGIYQDYHIASGASYEYRVIGVGSTGFIDSPIFGASLALQGVWLHVPSDPNGTARNYMFGKDQRSAARTSYSQLSRFAGRAAPVADFAHYEDQVFSVTVDVPFGSDWQDQLDALYDLEGQHTTLAYRDNRRRFAFGILTGLTETDTSWGTQVSFDFTKVYYNETAV